MRKKYALILVIILLCLGILAACSQVEFKITFMVDGSEYHLLITNGNEVIKMPNNPEKEGYEFDGWFWDEGSWQKPFTANSLLDAPLSENMSVYAKWTTASALTGTDAQFNGFTKTEDGKYYLNVPNATTTLSLGDLVQVNARSNWTLSSDIYGNNTVASKTATLAAGDNDWYVLVTAEDNTAKLYTLSIRRRPIYNVIFDANQGTSVTAQKVEEDGFATQPETTREGYDFIGWNYDFSIPITDNEIIIASWQIKTYEVTFEKEGGTLISGELSQTVEYNQAAIAPSLEKIGYILSWNKEFDNITKDTTVTAIWTTKSYAVTFDGGGGTYISGETQQTVGHGGTAAAPVFEKEGYDLSWNKVFNNVTDDLTVTAVWTVKTFNVIFEADGGTYVSGDTEQTVEYGQSATAPIFEKTGYELSWNKAFNNITNDLIVTAVWNIKTFNVAFLANGGTYISGETQQTVGYGGAAAAPVFEKTGYELSWNKDFSSVKDNITVIAVWNSKSYIINYYSNDGTEAKLTQDVTFNSSVTLFGNTAFTKTAYNLIKWNAQEDGLGANYACGFNIDNYETDGGLDLYAVWSPVIYSISYELNGGTDNGGNFESYTVESGGLVLLPPSRAGYSFEGWYLEDNFENKITEIEAGECGGVDLYARWIVTITFDTDNGSYIEPIIKAAKSAVTEPQNPTKELYEFICWHLDGNDYTFLEMPNDNITLKAVWIPCLDLNAITFNNASFVYDGSEKTVTASGIPFGVEVEYINNKRTNAGSAAATADFYIDGQFAGSKTATLEIEKADVTGITFASGSFGYDGAVKSLTIGGTLPNGVSVDYTNNFKTDAGIYTVTADFTVNENYNPVNPLIATLTINKADVSGLSMAGATYTYDGAIRSLAIEGALPGGVTVGYQNNAKSQAGTYEVTASFTVSGNYNAIAPITAILKINKATVIGLSMSDAVYAYNGTVRSLAISGTLPAEVSVDYENNNKANAGSHTVTASFTVSANYNAIAPLTATLTINKASITFTANNKTSIFGEPLKTLDFSTFGIIYNNDLSPVIQKEEGTNAGTYEITVVAGENANYDITINNAVYTVTKATYNMNSVTFANKTVTYNGYEQSVTVSGSLPSGVIAAYSNNAGVAAGTYNATAKFYGDADNYNLIADKTTVLVIEKATYNVNGISFSDATYIYDGTEKVLELTGTLPSGLSVSYSNNRATAFGTYYAVASFTGDFTNYNAVGNKTATLTINKATYDMSEVYFLSVTYTYDGLQKTVQISGTLPSGVTVSYESNTRTFAGTSNAVAKFTGGNSNYNAIPNKTATLTINKADYDMSGVSFIDQAFTYDGAVKSLAVSGTLPSGVSVSYTNNGKTVAGTYTVTAVFSGDAVNYNTIANKTAQLTVNKATPSLTPVCAQALTTSSVVTLNKNTALAGTIVFNAGQTLIVGTSLYDWTFSPSDTTNYNVATGKISLSVAATVKFYNETALYDTQIVSYEDKASKPANPSKADLEGYRYAFTHWSLSGDLFDFDTLITSDITLYAEYSSSQIIYSITYENEKGALNLNTTDFTVTQSVTINDLYLEHYTFEGWYTEESFATRTNQIPVGTYENKTVYAKWTPVEYTIDYVSEIAAQNNNPATYNIETLFTLEALSYTGYNFDGWFLEGNHQTEIQIVDIDIIGNLTLYAKWTYIGAWVYTATDMKNIVQNLSGSYKLANNITVANWTPLGDTNDIFSGVFEGNGFTVTITSMYAGNFEYAGLFGASSGTIRDLTVNSSSVITSTLYAGVIVGYATGGSVINCVASGEVKVESSASATYAGGLIGRLNGTTTVTNCYATGKVTANSKTNSNSSYAGGLIGRNYGGIITNCYATGAVYATAYGSSSTYGACAGGLIGSNGYGSIKYSYATGAVSATATGSHTYAYAGGLTGAGDSSNITVTNCYATGNVTSTTVDNYNYAGGLIGYSNSSANIITNCYATGNVTAKNNAGGLIGYVAYSTITNCYATGNVPASSFYAGGLIGYNYSAIITNSYRYVGQTISGITINSSGNTCSISNLNASSFFMNTLKWDESIWDFSVLDFLGGKYPKLKMQ